MAANPLFVLVVEDEGLIRMSLVEDLLDAGFKVFEASSADAALKVLDVHPEIDALFSDIDMPGSLDGLQLAKIVYQSRPEIAILLTSGYLKVARTELPPNSLFLSKPYDVNDVINHIREPGLR